jgi:hypothetical protein
MILDPAAGQVQRGRSCRRTPPTASGVNVLGAGVLARASVTCASSHGVEKRGRHHSPPPKPVTAASMLRDSGARAVSVLNTPFAVRMIPLKRSPDKAFGRARPAPEPVLVLGECSTARAGRPSFNGHASKKNARIPAFYCSSHGCDPGNLLCFKVRTKKTAVAGFDRCGQPENNSDSTGESEANQFCCVRLHWEPAQVTAEILPV